LDIDREYFLFLCDLRDSRSLSGADARKVFKKLSELKSWGASLAQGYSNELALPPSFQRGDEVSALFFTPRRVHEFARWLRRELYPECSFRFVVVKGKVTFPSDKMSQLGGPSFARANEELESLKSESRYCSMQLSHIPGENEVLSCLGELENRIVESMTEYQRAIFEQYSWWLDDSASEITLKRVAQELGKSISSVHRAREAGGVLPAMRASDAIDRRLYMLANGE